jgi:hypothetical protein
MRVAIGLGATLDDRQSPFNFFHVEDQRADGGRNDVRETLKLSVDAIHAIANILDLGSDVPKLLQNEICRFVSHFRAPLNPS